MQDLVCAKCGRATARSAAGTACPVCGGTLTPPTPTARPEIPARKPSPDELPADVRGALRDPANDLGKFVRVKALGSGGMGVVWKAWQRDLKRYVAIKFLAGQNPDQEKRLLREARLGGQLNHPNIAAVYEIGEHDGRPFLVMQYVEGTTIDQAGLEPRGILKAIRDTASALDFAHQRGIVHRDIKPSNIMVEGGHVYLMDFGLARQMRMDSSISQSQVVLGTPLYMSPEQARGQTDQIDARSDVYSLGASLYSLLVGRPPFEQRPQDDLMVLIQRVIDEEPRVPSSLKPRFPRELETIILKAMDKDRVRRYHSPMEFAEDIRRYLDDETILARRVGPWVHAVKWARRRPARSTLLLSALVLVIVGFVTWKVDAARRDLETETYFERIARAEQELSLNNVSKAEQLLEDCPTRLREWEWHCLRRLTHTFPVTFRGHEDVVLSVAISPRGDRVVSTDIGGKILLWEPAAFPNIVGRLQGHRGMAKGVAFSPDGKTVATAGFDRTVRIWDAITGSERRVFTGYTFPLYAVTFSADGKHLASCSGGAGTGEGGEVKVWDVASGKEILDLPQERRTFCVAFSPDGKRLAAGGEGNFLGVWECPGGRRALDLKGHAEAIFGVSFSPDGKFIASSSAALKTKDEGEVIVWDAASGIVLRRLSGHTNEIWSVTFSPNGRRLFTGSSIGRVKVWDPATGRESLTLGGHTDRVRCVALSQDGLLLVSASEDHSVKLWDAREFTERSDPPTPYTHGDRIWSVAFNSDGTRMASASNDGTAPIKVWDAASGRQLHVLSPGGGVYAVAFSPTQGSPELVSASYAGTITLWDTSAGKAIRELARDVGWALGVSFSPDGKKIAWPKAAGDDYTVEVFDLQTGKVRSLRGHKWIVTCVAFSPQGDRLASGGQDQAVMLWNMDDATARPPLQGHTGRIRSIAFSPDGRFVVSGSADERLKVWDLGSGQARTLAGHTGEILSVAYSPDGKRIASAAQDQTVRLWDAQNGAQTGMLRQHTSRVRGVVFSPNGHLAVTSGDASSGEVRLFKLDELEQRK